MQARAFDQLAVDYDATFSESDIGRALRALVSARLERIILPGQRILELGCGTGVDALNLARRGVNVVALDASAGMIQVAREKALALGANQTSGADEAGHGVLRGRVEFHCLPMELLGTSFEGQLFDGVLSNFGAINCAQDLRKLVTDVAARVRHGGRLVWVVMGRHVPWEWGWFLLQGHWSKAWRRLSRGGTSWRGLKIVYPTPGELAALLRPHFEVQRIAPLGIALPPSYVGNWLARWPRLSGALTRLEYKAHGCSALAALADHYVVEATRLDAGARLYVDHT